MNRTVTTLARIGGQLRHLTILVVVLGSPISQAADTSLKVGDAFPDLPKFPLEGELPATFKGKIVVVDFWASWCAPCKETFPLLEELRYRFGKQGLVILAVNEDKSRMAMTEFLKEYPVTFSVVRDAKKRLVAKVNVQVLPTSYILDGAGKVLSIESGTRIAKDRKGFIQRIERLVHTNNKERR